MCTNVEVVRALRGISRVVPSPSAQAFREARQAGGLTIWRTRDGQEPRVERASKPEPPKEGYSYYAAPWKAVELAIEKTTPVEEVFVRMYEEWRATHQSDPSIID